MEGSEFGAASAESTQKWTTDGIRALSRETVATRLFMQLVEGVERLNRRLARYGNPCVYDLDRFPWATELERDWKPIRRELDVVLERKRDLPNVQEITTDAASITQDSSWKIFPLIAYGIRSPPNIRACPETWRAVSRIPGLRTAMFSILEPGKHLPPHRGPYNGVLRLHLGLRVPEPRERTGIRVGSDVCYWEEGRALIFDDAYEHEAWNDTSGSRAVLFIDFSKPLDFPANLLNWVLLRLARFTPFLREGAENLRQWERRFYSSASENQTRG